MIMLELYYASFFVNVVCMQYVVVPAVLELHQNSEIQNV